MGRRKTARSGIGGIGMARSTQQPMAMRADQSAPVRGNLVEQVSGQLRALIQSGAIRPGEKLPSEASLTQQYAVSRTVIREAVAALRADGLVEPRQGAGVFVLSPPPEISVPFQGINQDRISSIIEILELRTAVEVEAAALAAQRRSPAQEETLIELCDDIDHLIADGAPTTDADYAFHLAIADATHNPRFREFLSLMGPGAIPRAALPTSAGDATNRKYLDQLQIEHRRIVEAIALRDEEAARQAMRAHLSGSQQRYRRLLRAIG